MSVVTISPKFQVVIPRHIREALKLKPGQKVQAFEYAGRVERSGAIVKSCLTCRGPGAEQITQCTEYFYSTY